MLNIMLSAHLYGILTVLYLYLLTFSIIYAIMLSVYAFWHNFMEDIMDDGDGETCHCMEIIYLRQA